MSYTAFSSRLLSEKDGPFPARWKEPPGSAVRGPQPLPGAQMCPCPGSEGTWQCGVAAVVSLTAESGSNQKGEELVKYMLYLLPVYRETEGGLRPRAASPLSGGWIPALPGATSHPLGVCSLSRLPSGPLG